MQSEDGSSDIDVGLSEDEDEVIPAKKTRGTRASKAQPKCALSLASMPPL